MVADPPEVMERFESGLELAEIIARQVARGAGAGLPLDDLVSFAREGLLDAARRFEPERGIPFKGFASFRVRGAIIDGVRSFSELPRRVHERLRAMEAGARVSEGALEDVSQPPPPGSSARDLERALGDHMAAMATAMATGLVAEAGFGEEGEHAAVSGGENPEHAAEQNEMLELLRAGIRDLPEQEAELVRRHYFEGERFDHVAAELGLSKSWASRLHTRAVQRLTRRLRPLA